MRTPEKRNFFGVVRAGHLEDADRYEVYLPRRRRLIVPITLTHDIENADFLLESTARPQVLFDGA